MAREATSGKYSVPPEIRALKPKDVSCCVKLIDGGYYVYEHLRVDDPKRPGKKKNATGKYLGVIAEGRFIPYNSTKETQSIRLEDPDNLSYGAYAIAIKVSEDILSKLKPTYEENDAVTIYVIALLYFVNHYIPARDLRELYIQSFLCKKYSTVHISENTAGEFLLQLGLHTVKRMKFEQLLIDQGSGTYIIDGHVILSCSRNNELADYGSKYQELKNTQANFMMMYDAGKKRPISCEAFDGGLPDKSKVADVIRSHRIQNSRFLVDSGFYSEEDLGLYRENNCTFIVPVPGTTILKKTILRHLGFDSSFIHHRNDSHGKPVESSVQYREYTVEAIEKMAVEDAEKEAEQKNIEMRKALSLADGEDLKTPAKPRHISKSDYPSDRIIVYKDQRMREKLIADFYDSIANGKHTEEDLIKYEPQFGVIVLRLNDLELTAEDAYGEYKDRWQIETYYDHVENGANFKGFHEEQYGTQQGVGFCMLIEGLIYAEIKKKIDAAKSPYIHNMSVDECIRTAGRLRISQHPDKTWHTNAVKGKINDLFEYFGVDTSKDLEYLDSHFKY